MRIGRTAAVVLFGVVLSVLVPSQATAQGFGIKGGVAMAKLRLSTSGEAEVFLNTFESERTFAGGIFLNVPLAVGFSLQPEAIYQTRRSRFFFDETPTEDSPVGYFEADYIEVPLLLRFQVGAGGSGLVLFGGPAVSFRMNAKSGERVGEEPTEEDLEEFTNSTDFGAVFGAGLQLGKFGVEGRYNLGFTNFLKEVDDVTLKWGTLSILASLRF